MESRDFTNSIIYKQVTSFVLLIGAIACFLLAVISYINPLLVNPTLGGMAFFGLSIAYLSLHFSFKGQIENAKENQESEKRIIRIERMVEKWDFD